MRPSPRLRLLAAATIAAAALFNVPAASPQDSPVSDTTLGIDFYKRGQYDTAVRVLRDAVKKSPADYDAWYYLGLVHIRKKDADPDDARKAFERAAALQPRSAPARVGLALAFLLMDKNREAERAAFEALTINEREAEARYVVGVVRAREGLHQQALAQADEALKINPSLTAATLLKSEMLLAIYAATYSAASEKHPLSPKADAAERVLASRAAKLDPLKAGLREATESLEKIIKAEPQNEDAKLWRELLDSTRCYGGSELAFSTSQLQSAAASSGGETSKAVITYKPEAGFTDEARAKCIDGLVRLRMVLTADGRVTCIMPVRTLAYGLTERAIRAARKIKFTPAKKDGRPVSQWLTVEYRFNCG